MKPRCIVAPNPSPMTLDGTRTYIVGHRTPVVIDPGPDSASHIARILGVLDGAAPTAIVVTHSHADHSGAATAVATATGSAIWSMAGRYGTEVRHHRPEAGEVIDTDDGPLRILLTPGHAPDHLAVYWRFAHARGAGAFVGDLLAGKGDTTLVGDPEGNVAHYLHSLDLLESLGCDVLYPAHGPERAAADAIRRHRQHRLRRIEQVRQLLSEFPQAPTSVLVDRVYGSSLDPDLRAAATASILAMLKYLGTVIDEPRSPK